VAAAAAGVDAPAAVTVVARALGHAGDLLGVAEQTFLFAANEKVSLQMVPGTTTFSQLDVNLELGITMQVCDSVDMDIDDLQVRWSWRPTSGGASWTLLESTPDVVWSRLLTPLSALGGPGDYTIRAAVLGASVLAAVDQNVTVTGIPLPSAILDAPANATRACGAILDASRSSDPAGASLSFAWRCASASTGASPADGDVDICDQLASETLDSVLQIPGGLLGNGGFLFTVNVSREGADVSAQALVVFGQGEFPVAAIQQPPGEVSPQQDLRLDATILAGDDCVVPAWRSWWLVSTSNGSVAVPLMQPSAAAQVVVRQPLLASPGEYLLRLVLSDADTASWSDESSPSVFFIDSSPFEVDAPPLNGHCRIYPEAGLAALTPFTLSSLDWVDDDLPLVHRFSASRGNAGGGSDWRYLNAWSQDSHFRMVLFGEAGVNTVRAEAQDTLGSVEYAIGTVNITGLPESESDETYLSLLDEVALTGDMFATLVAIDAVAEVGSSHNSSFASSLFTRVEKHASFGAPSSTGIYLVSDALESIVSHAFESSVLDVPVAEQGAELVISAATAAGELQEGLAVESGTLLLDTIEGLLSSVSANASEDASTLSDQLLAASTAIADSLGVGITSGDVITLQTSSRNTSMTVVKVDMADLAISGSSVGQFTVPAEAFNLYARSACTGEPAVVHTVTWPASPVGHVGSASVASDEAIKTALSIATGDANTDNVECCAVEGSAVQTHGVRLCGAALRPQNLANPVEFTVWVREQSLPDEAEGFRLCQFFDEDNSSWSDDGCWVTSLQADRIGCACNHLPSTFAGAYGARYLDIGFDTDGGGNIVSAGLTALGKGTWYRERGAAALLLGGARQQRRGLRGEAWRGALVEPG